MRTTKIDWENISDVSDVILPAPFRRYDSDGCETPGHWLGHMEHGSTVVDREGTHFELLGHGSVQGSVILRDPQGHQFHADVDQWMRYADQGENV